MEISCIPSTNVIVKRSFFYDVGMFDTSFDAAGGEDDLFIRKAIKMNASIAEDRSLTLFHDHSTSFWGLLKGIIIMVVVMFEYAKSSSCH